jgi:fluoride exporter
MPASLTLATALWVALGGAIGSVGRYVVSALMHRPGVSLAFPWATFAVNIVGALALGAVVGLTVHTPLAPGHRAFLTLGVLGGFTTFSTFAFESLGLMQSGLYGKAALYVVASVVLSIAAAALGFGLARG